MRKKKFLILSTLIFLTTLLTTACKEKEDKYKPHLKKVSVFHANGDAILGAAISSKSYYAIIGSKAKYPALWDLTQQKKLYDFEDPSTEGAYDYAFSADSQYALIRKKNQVSIWHIESQQRHGFFRTPDEITSADINYNGNYALLCTKNGIVFYIHSASGKVLRQFSHGARIETCHISPNNTYIATAGSDRTVKTWNIVQGTLENTISLKRSANKILLSKQLLFVAIPQGPMDLYSIITGNIVHHLKTTGSTVSAANFSPSEKYLVTANMPDAIHVWHIKTGELIEMIQLDSPKITPGQHYIHAIHFNESEKKLYIENATGVGQSFPIASLMNEQEKKAFYKESYIETRPEDPPKNKKEHSN